METSAPQLALSIHVTAAAEAADFEAAARTARDIRMARLDRIYNRVTDRFRDALRGYESANKESERHPRRTPEYDAARSRARAACMEMERQHARSWKLAQAMISTAGIGKRHAG